MKAFITLALLSCCSPTEEREGEPRIQECVKWCMPWRAAVVTSGTPQCLCTPNGETPPAVIHQGRK